MQHKKHRCPRSFSKQPGVMVESAAHLRTLGRANTRAVAIAGSSRVMRPPSLNCFGHQAATTAVANTAMDIGHMQTVRITGMALT